MTQDTALLITEKLIALALVLQSLEFLKLRAHFSKNGVWRWETLQKEFQAFPNFIYDCLHFLLNDKHFQILSVLRFIASILLVFFSHPALSTFLFLTHILVCLRWRGTFNGGSDYMTSLILLALSIARLFPQSAQAKDFALFYIAIQSVLSYFIAGFVKLKNNDWRTGQALTGFLESFQYGVPQMIQRLSQHKKLMFFASWSILIFELSAPLALIDFQFCIQFISWAFAFHLLNHFLFGLNRFVFAWLASYPAILYCSLFWQL